MNGAARRVLVLLMIGVSAVGLIWIGLDCVGRSPGRSRVRAPRKTLRQSRRAFASSRSPVAVEFNSARFVRAAVALTVRPAATTNYGKLLASATSFEQQTAPSAEPEDVRAFVDSQPGGHPAGLGSEDATPSELGRRLRRRRERAFACWTFGRWRNALAYAAILDIKARATRRRIARTSPPVWRSRRPCAGSPWLIAQLIRISVALQQCEAVRSLIIRLRAVDGRP